MFNESTKKTVDTLVPLAAVGGLYYYYILPRKMNIKDTVIYLAVAFLIVYLITSTITKNLYKKTLELQDQSFLSGAKNPQQTVTVDVVRYSNDLHADISGLRWFKSNNNEVYEDLVKMNAANLTAVAKQYESDWGESLYKAIQGESYVGFPKSPQDNADAICNRLKQLGLE